MKPGEIINSNLSFKRRVTMGIDIRMYTEKMVNGNWQFCMPESNRIHELENHYDCFDVGGRNPKLFQMLSQLYGEKYVADFDFESISKERGLPKDIDSETKFYMEGLVHCSYLTLSEIEKFNWDAESKNYGVYKDIAGEQFFEVIKYLKSLVTTSITENQIRIVWGYSC